MNFTLARATAHTTHSQALALSIQNIFLVAIVLALAGLAMAFFLEEIPLGGDDL